MCSAQHAQHCRKNGSYRCSGRSTHPCCWAAKQQKHQQSVINPKTQISHTIQWWAFIKGNNFCKTYAICSQPFREERSLLALPMEARTRAAGQRSSASTSGTRQTSKHDGCTTTLLMTLKDPCAACGMPAAAACDHTGRPRACALRLPGGPPLAGRPCASPPASAGGQVHAGQSDVSLVTHAPQRHRGGDHLLHAGLLPRSKL